MVKQCIIKMGFIVASLKDALKFENHFSSFSILIANLV